VHCGVTVPAVARLVCSMMQACAMNRLAMWGRRVNGEGCICWSRSLCCTASDCCRGTCLAAVRAGDDAFPALDRSVPLVVEDSDNLAAMHPLERLLLSASSAVRRWVGTLTASVDETLKLIGSANLTLLIEAVAASLRCKRSAADVSAVLLQVTKSPAFRAALRLSSQDVNAAVKRGAVRLLAFYPMIEALAGVAPDMVRM
jgi:hypothetical protein